MRLAKKISDIAFVVWKLIAPSLSEKYQFFDTRMLKANEMAPNFPWKQLVKQKNPYFKKWGFNVSQMDAEYYGAVSGIQADYYVTRSMAVHYIYPYLDRYDFVSAYMDKNKQKALLQLPDKSINVQTTEDVVSNSNGVYFDSQGCEISESAAVEIVVAYGKDTIMKPTVETFGGRGVQKLSAGVEKREILDLFRQYRYDFTIQKMVGQHEIMARFNPTSVNTIRVVTYRKPNRERKILYACVRFGGTGSVMDNVCSGGGFTGVDVATGKLRDRRRYCYLTTEIPMLPASIPNEIPYWEEIKNVALTLHGRLPQLDIVGWDFAISTEGSPVLIEFNPRPGVGLQVAVGPMFSKEDLDELMAHVSKVKSEYVPLGLIQFADRPDRKTVHLKFGGR